MGDTIDLNADLGEGCGDDAAMLSLVSSANIACGGHAGGGETMRQALAAAKAAGVAIGAHPSYPDRTHFGRRSLTMSTQDLALSVERQVLDLQDAAKSLGVDLAHIKPHGALYHDAARDAALAEAVLFACLKIAPFAAMVGPPGGALAEAAMKAGIPYRSEGFADRAYAPDGSLVSRGREGAVLTDTSVQTKQAVALATGAPIASDGGGSITLSVQTICIHGDSPNAVAAARAVHRGLIGAGFMIAAPAS